MIKRKREQLEQFIVEQTLGPGMSGFRFVDLNNVELLAKNLLAQKPIHYVDEIISIVPAGVYSTGILFPQDGSKLAESALANMFEKESSIDETGNSSTHRESEESSIDEDSVQIDQMYPNSMGLTCCLQNDPNVLKNIIINVQARYYVKVRDDNEESDKKYGVLCECDVERIKSFIRTYQLDTIINVSQYNDNWILTITKLKPDQIKDVQASLRNILKSQADKMKSGLSGFDFVHKTSHPSALKQSCYYELKNNCVDDARRSSLYSAVAELEEVENFISHIEDLLSVNGEGYGLWKSKPISLDVKLGDLDLTSFDRRKIFSYKKEDILKNIFSYQLGKDSANLSLNIQLSRDSRKNDSRIFLKVQLVNSSSPFIKDPENSRYYSTFNDVVNQRAFFGVKLTICDKNIVAYNSIDIAKTKDSYSEDDVTKFIYRQFQDFAVGHGCSVKWRQEDGAIKVQTEYVPICDTPDIEPIPRNKQTVVETNGQYEPLPVLAGSSELEFKWLSTFSGIRDGEILDGLRSFIGSYADWIELKRKKYRDASGLEQAIAWQELDKCEVDRKRMSNNIDVFLSGQQNASNLMSFRLMNSAMFMQLWHSVQAKKDLVIELFGNSDFHGFDQSFYEQAKDNLFSANQRVAWRPFQLAFILLNLDGIFKDKNDQEWIKRNQYVDLVWFPTGGGKTEAYLGIIALTIIHRRFTYNAKGGGTAAIMRYTLRLLTLQQFQRATLVIMALELIRRWNPTRLGEEPIFIGLWVGDNSLPNKLSSSDPGDKNTLMYEFRKLAEGQRSRVPFDSCPWCRSKLDPSNQVESDPGKAFYYNRLLLRCSNSKCSFYFRPSRARKDQGPIPVSLCDNEIYQHPPALLFGTVDKFAQLAHKVSNESGKRDSDSRRIFGKGNWEAGKPINGYLTPDLIIQDELHLLLGPLGSSVALFESAIDQLCTREDGTRPKVISSTATTRNTDLQIMALFDRKVSLFPKPGAECDDSFFSFYKRSFKDAQGNGQEYQSKRRYIGILPTGRTQIWMQMRLAAILMTHRALFELQQLGSDTPLNFSAYADFEKAMDYYHTVVSYFNSLKEVGKTESQIHTYIIKEIRRVFNRTIRPSKLSHALYTYGLRKGELTGRLSGEEVKNELEKVQSKWKAHGRFAKTIDNKVVPGSVPPDFVVATNMISVGIDVSRFNTILINSMPRNIAEYIQASSRVARDSYGIVLTIHHPFRARDVSHYEKFIEFHEKMYSYVEPISITPFTQKAVERYLGLYLATMIRHTTRFNNRSTAHDIRQLNNDEVKAMADQLSLYFDTRQKRLQLTETDDLVKNLLRNSNVMTIKRWIKDAIGEWMDLANQTSSENKTLVFKDKSKRSKVPQEQLYVDIEEYEGNIHSDKWQVPMSLRVIEPEAALKIKLK